MRRSRGCLGRKEDKVFPERVYFYSLRKYHVFQCELKESNALQAIGQKGSDQMGPVGDAAGGGLGTP